MQVNKNYKNNDIHIKENFKEEHNCDNIKKVKRWKQIDNNIKIELMELIISKKSTKYIFEQFNQKLN